MYELLSLYNHFFMFTLFSTDLNILLFFFQFEVHIFFVSAFHFKILASGKNYNFFFLQFKKNMKMNAKNSFQECPFSHWETLILVFFYKIAKFYMNSIFCCCESIKYTVLRQYVLVKVWEEDCTIFVRLHLIIAYTGIYIKVNLL